MSKSSQIPLFALVQPRADGRLRVQLARVPRDGSCGGMRMGRRWRQWNGNAIPQFRDSAIPQFSIRLNFGAEQKDAKSGTAAQSQLTAIGGRAWFQVRLKAGFSNFSSH